MNVNIDSYILPSTATTDFYYNAFEQPPQKDMLPLMAVPLSPKQSKMRKNVTFLYRLFEVLEDPLYQAYIFWLPCNTAIGYYSTPEFKTQILDVIFNNVSELSFIRQLNMYGFSKIDRANKLSTKNEFTLQSYRNPYFIRGRPELLPVISRKAPLKSTVKNLNSIVSAANETLPQNAVQEKGTLENQITQLNTKIVDLESKIQVCHQTYISQKLMIEKMLTYFPTEPISPSYTHYATPPRQNNSSPPQMLQTNPYFPQNVDPTMFLKFDYLN
ncbi:hypothetical protein HMI54_015460 [Coelomomyces lativittatus]|nr:hypothetical protein HMI54_015460 [Coelomomyces lativittatus]KAJ1515660.1 hypothetical protein HMI56_002673 [Coelomomyces lativittatus]KAJ1518089.1 hypothetical protein HMI55_003147 [Coelomomyces lativittatus]